MVVTEAPSVHRATEHICKLYQRFYTQIIYPKVIRNLYAIPSSLFVPSAPPWHCVYLRPLRDSVCLLYKTFSLSSIFRKSLLLPCYYVFYYPITMSSITLLPCLEYPVTMSWIPCYHVSYYPVPCLPLPCYHVSYYPVSCLPLLCYYVSYYPVSIKECKTTKKSWQANHPKEPYPSKQLTCQLVYLCTPST